MNKIVKQIVVSEAFRNIVQKHLDAGDGEENAHENAPFIETLTVDFGNGIEADIKICFERDDLYRPRTISQWMRSARTRCRV